MKLKQLFASLALASLSLLSCSQESEVHPVPEPGQEPATKVMQVTLETEEGMLENGLRLDQQTDPVTGRPTSPLMSDKPVKIRVAVRLNNDFGTIAYQILTFQKVGPLKVRYQGPLTVPVGSAPATDKYHISGILLAEDGVDGRVFTEVEGDEASSSIVKVKPATGLVQANSSHVLTTTAPYYSTWKEVTLVDGTNKPVTMTFKPGGTLLRMKVKNSNDAAVTVTGIKVETNAFFKDWYYDFARDFTRRTTPLVGHDLASGQRAAVDAWTEEFSFASPQVLGAQSETGWYYIWVMPVSSASGSTTLSTKITVLHSMGSSLAFQTAVAPATGASVALTLPIKLDPFADGNFEGYTDANWGEVATTINSFPNGKLPWEYVGGLLNSDANGMIDIKSGVIAADDARIGRFNYAQLQSVNVPGYRVATHEDMLLLFPRSRSFVATSPNPTIVETHTIAGQTFRTEGEYNTAAGTDNPSKRAVYGIRFKTPNNALRMAYKYENVYNSDVLPDVRNGVKISMKYIGADTGVTMDNLINESRATFWADAQHFYLPVTGEKYFDAQTGTWAFYKLGENSHFLMNDPGANGYGLRVSWFFGDNGSLGSTYSLNSANAYFPALLFKTNL